MFGVKKQSLAVPLIGKNSNQGARGKRNDDRYDHFVVNVEDDGELQVLVVADGVTSAEGSAQASEIAVKEVRTFLSQPRRTASGDKVPIVQWMHSAIVHAHKQILRVSQIYPEWRTMCTTVVLAVVHDNKLYVAHMGDSRAYLIRIDSIRLLTKDHTWIQDAIDEGMIMAKMARTHPKRHIVKRFLGIQENIVVDCSILDPRADSSNNDFSKTVDCVELQPDDAILLCSDGLTEKVEEFEIKQNVIRNKHRPQKAVDSLIKLALKRKEADNITAVLLKLPGN